MLNQHRLQPGMIARAIAGGTMPPRPAIHVEADRAPITFGWWLYGQNGFVGNYHLETLYRLDRIGARLGDHSDVTTLQPSQYYGQSAATLRELMRVRQHTLLPPPPPGHRWIGPQLVEEVVVEVPTGVGKLIAAQKHPQDLPARLDFARTLAAQILCDRVSA